jgi:hypothetical protein
MRMRELVSTALKFGLGCLVCGCATAKPAPKPVVASAAPATPAAAATIALVVHDPTDLQGRLATKLQSALALLGVTAHIVTERAAATDPLIVEVEVLNRQRGVDEVRTKREGSRTASGFGLISGGDDPVNRPEEHTGAREKFDYGKVQSQSDLRLITTASLSRVGDAEPLAKWDDTEGTLIPRATDGTQPVLHPWHVLYGALADKLAGQIRAAIPR